MCRQCNGGKRDRRPNDVYSADVVAEIERRLKTQADDWDIVELARQCEELELSA